MKTALKRHYYSQLGGEALPEILLSEDFTGTVIDTNKGAVTNPSSSDLLISQNAKLLFTRVTDNNNATENYWESVDSFTRGAFSVLLDKEVGYTNSIWFFRYHVDSSNFISMQASSASPGTIRVAIQKAGAALEYDVNSGISSDNRVKIVYSEDNEISFWYWNTSQWTQIGATQTQDIGASGKIRLGSTSVSTDAANDRFSFDTLRATDMDYSTELPD